MTVKQLATQYNISIKTAQYLIDTKTDLNPETFSIQRLPDSIGVEDKINLISVIHEMNEDMARLTYAVVVEGLQPVEIVDIKRSDAYYEGKFEAVIELKGQN